LKLLVFIYETFVNLISFLWIISCIISCDNWNSDTLTQLKFYWFDIILIWIEVYCDAPPTPKHGYLQTDNIQRFRGGDIVQFTCDPGFMLEGNPIVICQENSRWSGPPPSCKTFSWKWKIKKNENFFFQILNSMSIVFNWKGVAACTYPGTMHGGIISIVKFFYNVNETVQFDCADGYEIKGSNVLKCLENGRWSSSVPECHLSRRG